MKVLLAVLATALVTAGSSFAAAKTFLTVRPGDVVVANPVVCAVTTYGIACNVHGHADLNAVVSRTGIAVLDHNRTVFRRTFR